MACSACGCARCCRRITGAGHIVNADGLATEKEAWGKPANWCDYSGEIAGEKLGIAILDHPANPHHPVRWHVRGTACSPPTRSAWRSSPTINRRMAP